MRRRTTARTASDERPREEDDRSGAADVITAHARGSGRSAYPSSMGARKISTWGEKRKPSPSGPRRAPFASYIGAAVSDVSDA